MPYTMKGTSPPEQTVVLERKRRRVIFAQWALTFIVIVIIVAFSVGMAYSVIQIRATQRLQIDCSVPGGECYERGQQRLADAIDAIVDAQVETQENGSVITRENLRRTRVNTGNIETICRELGAPCTTYVPEAEEDPAIPPIPSTPNEGTP